MTSGSTWTHVDVALPPAGTMVQTMSPGGLEQRLVYESNLWWFPDKSMYVYYTPNLWRLIAT